MPLRRRILANPESIQDLVLASNEKYWEGIELLVPGRRGAGIYLLGYAAEMILKSACFLVDGARPNDQVQARLAPTRAWVCQRLPGIRHEKYHSLWFWAQALRLKRAYYRRKLPPAIDSGLLQRTHRTYGIWTVAMRYKPDESLDREAETMLADVTWIRDRQNQLVL